MSCIIDVTGFSDTNWPKVKLRPIRRGSPRDVKPIITSFHVITKWFVSERTSWLSSNGHIMACCP